MKYRVDMAALMCCCCGNWKADKPAFQWRFCCMLNWSLYTRILPEVGPTLPPVALALSFPILGTNHPSLLTPLPFSAPLLTYSSFSVAALSGDAQFTKLLLLGSSQVCLVPRLLIKSVITLLVGYVGFFVWLFVFLFPQKTKHVPGIIICSWCYSSIVLHQGFGPFDL